MTGVLTHHLWEGRGLHIQHDGALLYARPQLEQAVQGQGGHVWFAPSLPTLLYLLLKLDPPTTEQWDGVKALASLQGNKPAFLEIRWLVLHCLGSCGLMVGLHHLRGLFQPKWLCDSNSGNKIQSQSLPRCRQHGILLSHAHRLAKGGREEHIPAMSEGALREQVSCQRRRHKSRGSFFPSSCCLMI